MSVSVALATTAATQSAIAAAEAHAAHVAACSGWVRGYQHDAASVEQMRYYADCIATLYPAQIDSHEMLALKVAVALLLVGFFGGAVWGWRDGGYGCSRVEGSVAGALGGFLFTALGMLVVAGVVFGARFLLS